MKTAIFGGEIEGTGDVSRLVWDAEAGPVAIRILRDRSERTVTVDLPEVENKWHSDDGEMNGFFFEPREFDMQFDEDDVHVEWTKPVRELSRLNVWRAPDGPVNWVPAQSARLERRALSI